MAIKDTLGNYANTCEFGEAASEARNDTDPGLLEPVSAEFNMLPSSHSGPGSEIVFKIEFSEPVRVDIGPNHAYLLDVEGAKVTSAWWLDGDTTDWEIVLEPDDGHDIKITLPADRACDARGAPCGSGGRRLAATLEHTITGDDGPRETRSVKPDDTGEAGKSKDNIDEDDTGSSDKWTKSNDPPANTPATGQPAISGTAQVGEVLTADTTGIADADGLDNVSYMYQWIAGSMDIAGATGPTYQLSNSEVGLAMQVRVSFTDDTGNPEHLTSVATTAVASAPLTASLENEPASHDGENAFTFELRFSEHIEGLSYVTLRDHAFTATGGQVKKAKRMDRDSETRNIYWRITVLPDSDGDDVMIVLPATTDCGAQGAICTMDGRKLSNPLELAVSGPDG